MILQEPPGLRGAPGSSEKTKKTTNKIANLPRDNTLEAMPKAVVLVVGEIWEDMNRNMLKQQRVFRISGNNKELTCPFKGIVCPGGYCPVCPIYLDWLKLEEKVVICGSCGKVMYRISDFGRSVLFLGLCDECAKEGGS